MIRPPRNHQTDASNHQTAAFSRRRPISRLSCSGRNSHQSRSLSIALFTVVLLWGLCSPFGLGGIAPAHAQSAPSTVSGTSAPVSTPQLKADLNRILADDEFGPEGASKNPLAKWIEKLRGYWDQVRKWFSDLFSMGGLKGGGTALTYTLVTLMGMALLWIAYRLLREWKPRPRALPRPRGLSALQEEAASDIVRDPEHWRRQAEEYARANEFRPAYRALFLALLLTLDQAGIVSYDRARTNGDYIRALRTGRQAFMYELLLPPALAFDRFWYGQETVDAADYQALLGVYQDLPAHVAALTAQRHIDETYGSSDGTNAGQAQARSSTQANGERTL